jgi:hypothetical protein
VAKRSRNTGGGDQTSGNNFARGDRVLERGRIKAVQPAFLRFAIGVHQERHRGSARTRQGNVMTVVVRDANADFVATAAKGSIVEKCRKWRRFMITSSANARIIVVPTDG